ncbi:nucleolin [Anopheles stephensi]|uniref:nucleolin n=1 Tax=Anopheles stephensi TaxID=30069 RepID=UPI0016588FAF|nr:nucleolin [Anopheles stephensi]
MRSRTEMVTTTLDGSDFEEETDFEDSEEDWRPEKGDPKALKRKTRDIVTGSGGGGKRGGRGRPKGGAKRGRKPAGKSKGQSRRRKVDDENDDDDDDDDEDEDDEQFDSEGSESSSPPVPKRGRKSTTGTPHRANGRKSDSKTPPSTSKVQVKLSPTTSPVSGGLDASTGEPTIKPIQRKVANTSGSFPDKSGYLKLFASRADLEEGIRDNLKVCLWRRDGSSLLQKYFRDKSIDASTPQFISSMVYSCWEDKRADEYMEVKVRCIEQSKQLRVQIIDVDATENRAKEEYQKYIEKYGKTIDSAVNQSHNDGDGDGDEAGEGDEQEEEEYDGEEHDEEEEEEEMQEGVEGSDEPSQEE